MFGAADSVGYLFLEFVNNVTSLLLPIWVMLFLLRPTMKVGGKSCFSLLFVGNRLNSLLRDVLLVGV